jgi:cell division protease FtsH
MELRRFSRAPLLLLIAVAALLLLFVLGYPNPGRSYQQVHPSEIVSLINQGQVKSALIADKNQTIQITTKNGKQFEASWASSQGSQLQNALQAQLDQGRLPGGYNVNSAQSSALLDVLVPASVYLVIFLLFLWRIDFPAEIKWWRALADQAGQMAKRWEQQT